MTTLKTDFSDGDILYAGATTDNDKLNGITNEVNQKSVIHRKIFTDSTEKTISSVPSLEYNFSLSAPVNSLILNVIFKASLDTDGQMVTLQFTGTNLGTKYLTTQLWRNGPASSYFQNPIFSNAIDEGFLIIHGDSGNTYEDFSRSSPATLKILDTSTTIQVRVANSTGKIKNVELEIVYATPYAED
ncbi:MAG: hypothetical protein EOL97_16830 [Spirochaetia bacterium]|nr:hypothetical protein [Spirochaetia bacterium]